MSRRAFRACTLASALLAATAALHGGQAPDTSQTSPAVKFRVGVDIVRIDAVVTDRDGRTVPDLTTADFQVRQDGKLQRVTYAQYMPVSSAPAPAAAAAAPGSPAAPAPAAPSALSEVKAEEIQRTLAIVVDDLGLSVESFQGMTRALHAFIDKDLAPSDLVAVVRTGGTGGGLQPFTTDRRVLHAAIDELRWNGQSRVGVEPFLAVNSWKTFSGGGPAGGDATKIDPDDFRALNQLRGSMSAAGTLGALNLVIRGTRELPGRKAVILVTEGFQLLDNVDGGLAETRTRSALDRVTDQATRAGVVIYTLDPRGLQTGGLLASDNLKNMGSSGIQDFSLARTKFNRDTQEGMAYLAEQTGGFAVLNTNDLGWGLGRIANDVRDYYVIGYEPAAGTFAHPGEKPALHKISITATRPGLKVKTRKEFLGVTDPPDATGPATPAQALIHAATSPFGATEIALHATTLPGFSPEKGTFIRALLHIDAKPLTFVDTPDGKKTASVDVLGMVFDQDGTEVAHLTTGFAMGLSREAKDAALGDGLAYMLRIPIPRPGAYQVRFAVRDQQSGALGSAGEFVDVDNIAGGAFALSGIVLRAESDATSGTAAPADDMALTPAQALRIYRPGTKLSYAYEIYNADGGVQSATSIWRGPERILAAAPDTLVPPAGETRRFAAAGGIRLGEKLPPGSYVLEITAVRRDPRAKGPAATAVQRMGFEVR